MHELEPIWQRVTKVWWLLLWRTALGSRLLAGVLIAWFEAFKTLEAVVLGYAFYGWVSRLANFCGANGAEETLPRLPNSIIVQRLDQRWSSHPPIARPKENLGRADPRLNPAKIGLCCLQPFGLRLLPAQSR